VNDYLALQVTLLISRVRNLTQKLLIFLCACEVGYECENAWGMGYSLILTEI